jgi:hypothetical protein
MAPRKCAHGNNAYYCLECPGKGVCVHRRQRGSCKPCGGKGICVHNKHKFACRECSGSAYCRHQKRKILCAECKGSSLCQEASHASHGMQKSQCRECKPYGMKGSVYCKHEKQRRTCRECGPRSFCCHNLQRSSCRLCNPKHQFHGVDKGHGRGSDFEHMVIEALLGVLPEGSSKQEQMIVPHIDPVARNDFRADMRVDLPGDEGSFVVEADGPDHYVCEVSKMLGPVDKQLARDRHVEAWCLSQGLSVFRVPYTLAKKVGNVAAYVLAAARADRAAGVARVHYLDFARTYARIDAYAAEHEDVQALLVEVGPDGVGVGRRAAPAAAGGI